MIHYTTTLHKDGTITAVMHLDGRAITVESEPFRTADELHAAGHRFVKAHPELFEGRYLVDSPEKMEQFVADHPDLFGEEGLTPIEGG